MSEKIGIDREQFEIQFVTTFLASWCAKHFEDFHEKGIGSQLCNPPVRDAIFLASEAWEKVVPYYK